LSKLPLITTAFFKLYSTHATVVTKDIAKTTILFLYYAISEGLATGSYWDIGFEH